MNLALAMERVLGSPLLDRVLRPSYPTVAVEVASGRLISVAGDRAAGRAAEWRMEELPPGVLRPSLLKPGVLDPTRFRPALKRVVEGLPGFEGKLSLVLPDQVAKIGVLELQDVSQTTAELRELVRFRLKRSTPFRVEDARISLQVFRPSGALKLRCMVSLILDSTVEQLEAICEGFGWEVGQIDISSFDVWNLVEPSLHGGDDCLVFNMDDTFATAMVARAGEPAFLRCRAPPSGLPVSWDRVKEELHPTLLYYEDRIGGAGIPRAIVRAPVEYVDELCDILATKYGMSVERIETRIEAGGGAVEATDRALLAPALGAALRS